jgi:hypothetical protein
MVAEDVDSRSCRGKVKKPPTKVRVGAKQNKASRSHALENQKSTARQRMAHLRRGVPSSVLMRILEPRRAPMDDVTVGVAGRGFMVAEDRVLSVLALA